MVKWVELHVNMGTKFAQTRSFFFGLKLPQFHLLRTREHISTLLPDLRKRRKHEDRMERGNLCILQASKGHILCPCPLSFIFQSRTKSESLLPLGGIDSTPNTQKDTASSLTISGLCFPLPFFTFSL